MAGITQNKQLPDFRCGPYTRCYYANAKITKGT